MTTDSNEAEAVTLINGVTVTDDLYYDIQLNAVTQYRGIYYGKQNRIHVTGSIAKDLRSNIADIRASTLI